MRALVGLGFWLSAAMLCAQDSYNPIGFDGPSLGDAARAARASHATAPKAAVILNNDDLQHEVILPATTAVKQAPAVDRSVATDVATVARVRERREVLNAPTPRSIDEPTTISLGTYARAIREEKAERQASEFAQIIRTTPEMNVMAMVKVELKKVAPSPQSPLPPIEVPISADLSLGNYAHELRAQHLAPAGKEHAAPIIMIAATVPEEESHAEAGGSMRWREVPLGVKPAAVTTPLRMHSSPASVHHDAEIGVAGAIIVHKGDSLWRLAQIHLKDGRLWSAFWHANPEVRDPDRIRIGQMLRLPDARTVEQARLQSQKNRSERELAALRWKNVPVVPGIRPQTLSISATSSPVPLPQAEHLVALEHSPGVLTRPVAAGSRR